MPSLYGSRDILSRRNSGYKSSVNALAEIVDNSIDAQAKNVIIELIEGPVRNQQNTTIKLLQIRIIDDGCGMDPAALNQCLAFGAGSAQTTQRIGRFGYGLPNSSISVARRVDVISKTQDSDWHKTHLDIDEITNQTEPNYPEAQPVLPPAAQQNMTSGTIITWSKLDRCDAATAKTFAKRCAALLGRLYRYQIGSGDLKIHILTRQKDNRAPDTRETVNVNDPLFQTTLKCPLTGILHQAASEDDLNQEVDNPEGDDYWNAKTHYAKFIDPEKPNQQKPIFRKCEAFWDLKREVRVGDKTYVYTLKAAHAYASITNPGRYKGGATKVGRHLGQKMSGTDQLPSANIFWVREGRELDFGSYSLYTVTNEKHRFWTIEIHFDNSLDDILGVSNTKQSVSFRAITQPSDTVQHGVSIMHAQELVFHDITTQVKLCIDDMMKTINSYMRAHKQREAAAFIDPDGPGGGDVTPVPTPSGPIIKSIPLDAQDWTIEQQTDVIEYLKSKYPHLEYDAIKEQVERTVSGQTQSIVLYVPTDSGKLFDIVPARGKTVIAFNSNHEYFNRIIEPLKSQRLLYPFTVALEMFISSFATNQSIVKIQYSERNPEYVNHVERYVDESSTLLKRFLLDQDVSVNPEFVIELKKILSEEIDSEFSE